MNRDRGAFAAWVRVHHPDVGGDPAEFAAGLVRWRAAGHAADVAVPVVCAFRSRHGLWLVARWLRRRRRGPRVL